MSCRLILILMLILLTVSMTNQNLKHLSQNQSKKQRNQPESDSQKLVAHPFLNKNQFKQDNEKISQSEESVKNTKQTDKQKKQADSQLGSEWHIFFALMIMGTLAGMKILDNLQRNIKHTNHRQSGHQKILSKQTSEQYDFSN